MAESIDLRNLFKGMQTVMQAKLNLGRSIITHDGEMGEAAEESWREWLREYLPKRYKVDKAFVIDSHGIVSDQIDIVIYDGQYSYFVFSHEHVKYVPAESVYAVIECKQVLNKANLDYAGKKAVTVRNLYRTSVEIPYAAGRYPPKPLHYILSGIVANESAWKDPLGNTLQDNIRHQDSLSFVDFGCALQDGSFWAERNPEFVFHRSAADESLLFFFLKLLMKLQSIGTVPAIDTEQYAKSLQSFE